MLEQMDLASTGPDVCGQHRPGLGALLDRATYTHVVLMAGTNDLGEAPATEIAARLQSLHAACHLRGARTVAVSVPESKASCLIPWVRERRFQVNQLLSEFAESVPDRCLYVSMDIEVPWTEGSNNWEADGLHMSRAGYHYFGMRLATRIREFVQICVRSPKTDPG